MPESENEANVIHTNDPAELFACLQVNCGKVAGSGSSVSQGTLLYVFGGVGEVEKRGGWVRVRKSFQVYPTFYLLICYLNKNTLML